MKTWKLSAVVWFKHVLVSWWFEIQRRDWCPRDIRCCTGSWLSSCPSRLRLPYFAGHTRIERCVEEAWSHCCVVQCSGYRSGCADSAVCRRRPWQENGKIQALGQANSRRSGGVSTLLCASLWNSLNTFKLLFLQQDQAGYSSSPGQWNS